MNGDQMPAAKTLPDGETRAVALNAFTAELTEPGAPLWRMDPTVDTIASRALGGDMTIAHQVAPATHPDPASVPWPDGIGCPFWPAGMYRGWYVFEERYPPPGFRRAVQYISERQIQFAEFMEPLQLRVDWLATHFPVHGGNFGDWDTAAVVAWLRHHIGLSCQRRNARPHREQPAQASAVVTPPAPAPVAAPTTWRMEFKPLSAVNPIPRICSLHAERDGHGRVVVAVVFRLPNGSDAHGAKVKLSAEESRGLGEVLAGVARAKP